MKSQAHSYALSQSSALALATGMMLTPSVAAAQSFEAEGIVVEGGAQILESPDFTEIIVETPGVVIDWLPFDPGAGDLLFQPFGTTAVFKDDGIITDFAVLNRILPTDLSRRVVFDGTVVSEIQGQIGGTVFFYSPGGILVGETAVFDVGNLGLTTADPLSDGNGNFITGNQVTFQQSTPTSSITINPNAQIFADQNPGSYVALFAPSIVNRGSIIVDGQAALVGGEAGTITFSPDGLFDIQVDIGSEFAQPIENTGIIGGAASLDGSSRVYMVAISKNAAATIAIRGGSSLGFDIANSAFMDGDTVVLSAGFNITAGEIETTEASNGFIDINPEPLGFGTGITFTSNAAGKAASDVNLFVRESLTFEGDATFSGRQAIATLNTDFGTGSVGNLTVGGDLSLLADHSRPGADVGIASLRLFDGTLADIAGNLRVGSIGTVDGNGDGQVLSSTGEVLVQGLGSQLNVSGNLVAESSVDLAADPSGLFAGAGFAVVSAEDQGVINVGGVTRVKSEAQAGIGGSAQTDIAEIRVVTSGNITTGEANIVSRAIGGDGDAMGVQAGSATSGTASISANDAGSAITVLNANTIGDPFNGELDFLVSEAVGGFGFSGSGGAATTGGVQFSANPDAAINLPDVPSNPLRFLSLAIGGDTFVDDAFGGDAFAGGAFLQALNDTRNLGRISLVTEAIGGTAAPGTARSLGGMANAQAISLFFSDTNTTIALDELRTLAVGGTGSGDTVGVGGDAQAGGLNLTVTGSTLNVQSNFNFQAEARGGEGAAGGSAITQTSSPFLANSTVSIGGDFILDNQAFGGSGLDVGGTGGNAETQFIQLNLENASLTANGLAVLNASATGGDALDGDGGNATTGRVDTNISGGSNLSADSLSFQSNALGGSAAGQGFGQGGAALTDHSRLTYTFDGTTDIAAVNADVIFSSNASGGNAAAAGGDGGSATSGNGEIYNLTTGTISINGNTTFDTRATGGAAPQGLGGDAIVGSADILAQSGGSILISGGIDIVSFGTGGDGQTGGDVTGGQQRVFVRGTLSAGGGLTVDEQLFGGNALASDTPGAGGNAQGGDLQIIASNEASIPTSSVTLGGINIASIIVGGAGGEGLNGADGGLGGNATGSTGFILGQAINGVLQVNGATTLNANVIGGQGGVGVNGGDGGQARFGGLQIGTSSGGSVPDTVGGSATFADIDVVRSNLGGSGGEATNGTGGTGGEAVGGSASLLVRGANVTADNVNFILNGTGGNGGLGMIQGNGGDGVGGNGSLLATEALDNPFNGSANIGSLMINSAGQGGVGAVAGESEFATGGEILVEQADVMIGSISVSIQGESEPDYLVDDEMGGQSPVTFNPFLVTMRDHATLDFGSIDIDTAGDLELFSSNATATANSFDIVARGLAASGVDVTDPAFVPGLFDVASSLTIETTAGDLDVKTLLASAGDLILNSAGGITTLDLTGGSIFLTLGAGGLLDTGILSAPGGLVAIQAEDSLTAPTDIDAASVLLRSLTGDVNIDDPLIFSGGLTAEAAQSINVTEVDAGTVTLMAGTGDIVASGPIRAAEFVDLSAGGGIAVTTVDATSILAFAQSGGFSAGTLTAIDNIGVEASGTVDVVNVDAGSLGLRSLQGFVNSGGTLSTVDNAEIEALNGSVNLTNVNAGSVNARAGVDLIVGGVVDANGAVDLEAIGGGLAVSDVSGASIALRSMAGSVAAQGALTSMGSVAIEAEESIVIDAVTAGSINVDAQGGDITATGVLSATGATNLLASGSISLGDLGAGSIFARAGSGSLIAGNLSAPSGPVDLESFGAIEIVSIDALSILLRSLGGAITISDIISAQGNATIEAEDDISVQMAAVGSLGLRSLLGSLNLNGDLAVQDAANIDANGNITATGTIDTGASAVFNAGGALSLADVSAGQLVTQSGGLTSVAGTWQAPSIAVFAPQLDLGANAALDAGTVGSVSLNSTNAMGVVVGANTDDTFEGLMLDTSVLERITAGNLVVTAFGTEGANGPVGATILLGDLDVTGFAGLTNLTLTATESIDIVGALVSDGDLALQAEDVTLNTETGRIDLGTDETTLLVNAGSFIVGDSTIRDDSNGDLSNEEAQALVNAPAVTPIEEGVITTGSLILNVADVAVIQNVGTEGVPAGFVIGSAEGLVVNGDGQTGALVILNGQIAGADGANATGDDAATAIFTSLAQGETFGIGAGSQINGCDFAGCTPITEGTGEITSTVSASVNGATAAATSSTSSGAGASTTGTGEASSESSSEEGGPSSAPANGAATGTASTAGGEISVENVDDGGSGPGEFSIEPGDTGGSAPADASGDAGADAVGDAVGESSSDSDAGSEGSSDADGGTEESESSSSESDTSEGGEDAEEGDNGEETEETEGESEEEETEEEEDSTEDEEEDSEGPASGPINPPPSLINTNTLDQRGAINDPISGSGNPALLDPEVATSNPGGDGGQ